MNVNSQFPPGQQGQSPHFLLQQLQQHQQQQQQQTQSQVNQSQAFNGDMFLNQQAASQQAPQQQQQQPQQASSANDQALNASNILAQTLYQNQYGRGSAIQPAQTQQHAQQQMQAFNQQLQQAHQSQAQTQQNQQQLLLAALQQQQAQQAQQQQQNPQQVAQQVAPQVQAQPSQQAQQSQQQQQQQSQPQMAAQAQPQTNQLQSINLDTSTNTCPFWKAQVTLCQASRNSNSIPHYWAKAAATSNKKLNSKLLNGSYGGEQTSVKQPTLIDLTVSLIASMAAEEAAVITAAASSSSATPVHDNALFQNKKTSNDLELDEEEEHRIRIKQNDPQLWTGLDLSGQQIMYLSTNLFNYQFLNKLYLNGNKLQSIPSSIGKLKNLKYLDISNNLLKQLPEELGLLFHLKYLYAFDNNLTTIPFKFGNLFELDFLGIEGNPSMDQDIINILAKKGTKGLIIHLRDSSPAPEPPKEREWIYLSDQGERLTEQEALQELHYVPRNDNDPNGFSVMTYNTLCQHYATAKMHKYTPTWALDWDYRRNMLTKQVLDLKTDIICLQEVETRTYEEYWTPELDSRGYKGVFGCKTRAKTMTEKNAKKVDGCAIFYKTSKFEFIEYKTLKYSEIVMRQEKYEKTPDLFNRLANKDNIAALLLLKHKETGQKLVMVNTHLHWDPEFNDVKAMQICILLEELQLTLHKSNLKNCSVMIAGDFNSQINSAVFELLSTGATVNHFDFEGKNYGRITSEGFQHQFNLKSAYSAVGELPLTNLTPAFTDTIDYIWYSNSTLSIKGLLGEVDPEYCANSVGFPDAHHPSDHIPLVTKVEFKKSHTTNTQKLGKGTDFSRMGSRRT